jgi:hypothetical protein
VILITAIIGSLSYLWIKISEYRENNKEAELDQGDRDIWKPESKSVVVIFLLMESLSFQKRMTMLPCLLLLLFQPLNHLQACKAQVDSTSQR